MLELKFVEHKEMDTHDVHYEADIYTIGSYKVSDEVAHYEGGHKSRHIYVQLTGEEKYLPEIHFDDGIVEGHEPSFHIQTTSYGTLTEKEYAEFLAAQWKGYDVVTTLTAQLLKKER